MLGAVGVLALEALVKDPALGERNACQLAHPEWAEVGALQDSLAVRGGAGEIVTVPVEGGSQNAVLASAFWA